MSDPIKPKPAAKVGALWLLILAAFAVFNAAYWPARARSAAMAPESFHARAAAAHAAGDTGHAIAVARAGIARFQPPLAAPYADLRGWLEAAGHAEEAARLAPVVAFKEALDGPAEARAARFVEAARAAADTDPVRARPESMRRAAAMLAGVLGVAIGAGHAGLELDYPEQLALLRAAGGALRDDGVVGETGVRSPVNILVQSGGGEGLRRQAHIVVEGRDWGGARRGMHVALVDPDAGQVTVSSVFDVWRSEAEADRLTRFLQDVLPGTIAAFAVYDDASAHLDRELEEALRGFGIERRTLVDRVPAIYGRRFSFAAIGVKGAGPGSALQAWSPGIYRVPGEPAARAGHPVVCGVLLPEGDAP